ncbi:acetylcholinesterase-like [Ornithodoros turicata]|uniref:acetylcholinesterase-like n=1 Tax=Ornithodoros turicata TaxID=34597 RepID=UPI00313873F8
MAILVGKKQQQQQHLEVPVGSYTMGLPFPRRSESQLRSLIFPQEIAEEDCKRIAAEVERRVEPASSPDASQQSHTVSHRVLETCLQRHSSRLDEPTERPRLCHRVLIIVAILSLLGFLLLFIFVPSQKVVYSPVSVQTPSGTHMGDVIIVNGRQISHFAGIPFADNVGLSKRFALADTNVHSPAAVTLPCPQQMLFLARYGKSQRNTSESCLHLSVWTPHVGPYNKTVVFFLFGWLFYYGSNDIDVVHGALMASRGDVVVVVPNYRVDLLGFLSDNTKERPGNLAFDDQRLALEWVRKNINYFGGDPFAVILHGYEAGSVSVGYHMMSPQRHWIQGMPRAILQSGSPYRPLKDNTEAFRENIEALAGKLRCRDPWNLKTTVSCLSEIPTGTLLQFKFHTNYRFGPKFNTPFLPCRPACVHAMSPIRNKQILIGFVRGEGIIFTELLVHHAQASAKQEDFKDVITKELTQYGIRNATELVEYYLPYQVRDDGREKVMEAVQILFGDVFYICPIKYFAEKLSVDGNQVFVYLFNHKPSFSVRSDTSPAQFEDMEFLFGNRSLTGVEHHLQLKMIELFSKFAKNGYLPSVNGSDAWPFYTRTTPTLVEITEESFHVVEYFRDEICRKLRPHILPL